jgi:hypothetical protein
MERVAAVVVVLVVAAGAGIGIGAAIAPTSPAAARQAAAARATAALRRTLAAAEAAGSFRYVEESDQAGQTETIAGAATTKGGTQDITLGADHWHLILVGTAVYFSGNASAMVDQLGAPASVARTDAGKWIAVPRSTGNLYQSFEVGITTSSNLSQIRSPNGLGFSARQVTSGTIGHTSVTEIHGILSSGAGATTNTATLVVDAATDLPMALQARVSASGTSESFNWTFTDWHHPVTVRAPVSPIPYRSLGATPPSSSSGAGPSAQGPTPG